MSHCACPGCARNDGPSNDSLYYEYMSRSDTWCVVCEKHVDDDKPTVELTDDVKQIPVGTLTQIKNDLLGDEE